MDVTIQGFLLMSIVNHTTRVVESVRFSYTPVLPAHTSNIFNTVILMF